MKKKEKIEVLRKLELLELKLNSLSRQFDDICDTYRLYELDRELYNKIDSSIWQANFSLIEFIKKFKKVNRKILN